MGMTEINEKIEELRHDLITAEDARGRELLAASIRVEIHDLERERDLLPAQRPTHGQ